jgi:hypothetical protein
MIPDTETRVMRNTKSEINGKLQRDIEMRLTYYAGHPEQIDTRLRELDREWDIERVLETNAAAVSLFGSFLASRRRKWLLLPMAVAGFLMQHAIQGWCPPVAILRRKGVRTTSEINSERYALKAIRGDFDSLGAASDPIQRARSAFIASSL